MPQFRRLVRRAGIAAAIIAIATPAAATTVVSLSGTGVLQITTSGDLHFGGLDLSLDRVVLIAQETIVGDFVGAFPPVVADTILVYPAVSGTTVLEFDDDVHLPFLEFTGSIDFRARRIVIHGGLDVTGEIWVGSAVDPGVLRCTEGSGVIVGAGGSTTERCTSPPIVGGIPPIGPIDVTAVPEPGAGLLFALGAVLAAATIRRAR